MLENHFHRRPDNRAGDIDPDTFDAPEELQTFADMHRDPRERRIERILFAVWLCSVGAAVWVIWRAVG